MPLTDNLIGYWKLDETSGTRVDSHSNGYDLTDNATVTSQTGKINNAAEFLAANSEFLSRASNSDLQTGDVDFTFACWVWLDQVGAVACVASKRDTLEWELRQEADGKLRFFFGSNAISVTATSFGVLSTGQWYYAVCWHDATANEIGISVNGTSDTASDSGAGASASSGAFRIGSENGANFFSGRVDEAGFWKRTLSSQDRTDLYNGGSGLAYPFSTGAAAGGIGTSRGAGAWSVPPGPALVR